MHYINVSNQHVYTLNFHNISYTSIKLVGGPSVVPREPQDVAQTSHSLTSQAE